MTEGESRARRGNSTRKRRRHRGTRSGGPQKRAKQEGTHAPKTHPSLLQLDATLADLAKHPSPSDVLPALTESALACFHRVEHNPFSSSFGMDILRLCEELVYRTQRDDTFRAPVARFCVTLVDRLEPLIPPLNNTDRIPFSVQLRRLIRSRTIEEAAAPVAALLLDQLHALLRGTVDTSDRDAHRDVITDILTRSVASLEEGRTHTASRLWLSAWLISCFPALAVSFLFAQFTSKMNRVEELNLPGDVLQWSSEQLDQQGVAWQLTGEIRLLAYGSTESASYWAHSLSLLLEEASTAPATLLGVLLFFPQGVRANAWIVLTAWRELLRHAEKWSDKQQKQMKSIVAVLPLRLDELGEELDLLFQCLVLLPLEEREAFNQFLERTTSCWLEGTPSQRSGLACQSFRAHVGRVQGSVVQLCQWAVPFSTAPQTVHPLRATAAQYLQSLLLLGGDAMALDVLFHLFVRARSTPLAFFQSLLALAMTHYAEMEERFITRVVEYLPQCSHSSLLIVLTNLCCCAQLASSAENATMRALLHSLAQRSHGQVLLNLLAHENVTMARQSFQLLRHTLLLLTCPMVLAAFTQQLLTAFISQLQFRTARVVPLSEGLDQSLLQCEWILCHLSELLVDLVRPSDSAAMQLLDLVLDWSFSSHANDLLRKVVAGMVGPTNYLLLPDPQRISGAFRALFHSTDTNETDATALEHSNRTRRLFGKHGQQSKVFPPPAEPSHRAHEENKRKKMALAYNQATLVRLVSQVLDAMPSMEGKFGEVLLVRMSSPYPLPSDEQYLEVLKLIVSPRKGAPKPSFFEYDLYVRKLFIQNPVLIQYVALWARDRAAFVRCYPVMKSLLASLIGDWNITTHTGNEPDHIFVTIELVKILAHAQWLPSPLAASYEILPLIAPKQGASVLYQLWRFLRENPPQAAWYLERESVRVFEPHTYKSHSDEIKRVLQNNMERVVPYYNKFFG